MTKGEYRVGVTFNPSGDDQVTAIKAAAARFIDLVEGIQTHSSARLAIDDEACRERGRLKALARTAAEEAAMWAVKAATKPNRAEG
jgi:hypothetical protein